MRRLLLWTISWKKKIALSKAMVNLCLRRKAFAWPVYYQIEITTRCNLQCPHCPRFHTAIDNTDLPFDLFRRLIDDNPSLIFLLLQGLGEPLLHPQLIPMISYARQKGILTMMCTNATRLTRDKITQLLQADLNLLAISLDDVGAELEKIRPPTRYELLKSHLENLRDLKRGSNLIVSFWVTIQTQNVDTFYRVIDLAREIEIDQLNFQHMGYTFAPVLAKQCLLHKQDLVQSINRKIRTLCRQYGIHCNILSHKQNIIRKKCLWPWFSGYVDVHGNLMACCGCFDPADAMGRLESESIRQIWNNPLYQNFRAGLTSAHIPKVCINCHNL